MSSSRAPPDAYLKRLEALDGPPKPPVTIYRAEPRMRKLIEGLNSTDLEIVRRLEKLREERHAVKNVPTEDEIAHRLALLRGQNADHPQSSSSKVYIAPDTRSAEQKTQDLLSQLQEEVEIDAKLPNPDDVIAERLNRLRNRGDSSTEKPLLPDECSKITESVTLDEIAELLAQCNIEAAKGAQKTDLASIVSLEQVRSKLQQLKNKLVQNDNMEDVSSSDEDDEKAAKKILAKVQAEVDLERSLGITEMNDDEAMDVTNDDTEEFSWCIICNEDAKIRCLGCDRDLYCKSCFQEGHRDEDTRCHAFEPYKSK